MTEPTLHILLTLAGAPGGKAGPSDARIVAGKTNSGPRGFSPWTPAAKPESASRVVGSAGDHGTPDQRIVQIHLHITYPTHRLQTHTKG